MLTNLGIRHAQADCNAARDERRALQRLATSLTDKFSFSDQAKQRAFSTMIGRPLFELLLREDRKIVRFDCYSAAIQSMLNSDSTAFRQYIALLRRR